MPCSDIEAASSGIRTPCPFEGGIGLQARLQGPSLDVEGVKADLPGLAAVGALLDDLADAILLERVERRAVENDASVGPAHLALEAQGAAVEHRDQLLLLERLAIGDPDLLPGLPLCWWRNRSGVKSDSVEGCWWKRK